MTTASALLLVVGVILVATALGLLLRALPSRRRTVRLPSGDAAGAAREIGVDLDGGRCTFVQFSTVHCARCPGVRRALRPVAAGHGITWRDVDLTDSPEIAARWKVLTTPTLVLLDPAGSPLARWTGAVTAAAVRQELTSLSPQESP